MGGWSVDQLVSAWHKIWATNSKQGTLFSIGEILDNAVQADQN